MQTQKNTIGMMMLNLIGRIMSGFLYLKMRVKDVSNSMNGAWTVKLNAWTIEQLKLHCTVAKSVGTVPSSCHPAPAAGRLGARESYYCLCATSTTSASMRRAIETPRDTDQWRHRLHDWGVERAFAPGTNLTLASALDRPRRSGPHWAAGDGVAQRGAAIESGALRHQRGSPRP